MSDSPPSAALVARYHEGDAQALQQLLDRYSCRLIEACRRHVSPAIAARHDAQDVAQSALRSFLRGLHAGTIRINTANELWRLLVVIAVRKARKYARRVRADPAGTPAPEGDLAGVLLTEPGPDEAAAFDELVAQLLHGLPERHGLMLRLLLEERWVEDVARQVGVSRHSVYRVRRLFQQRARRAGASDSWAG